MIELAGLALIALRTRAARPRPQGASRLPPVSIVVPARNEEANLPRLLDSLRRLDYPSIEILVVDDGSTDATAEIARDRGARVVVPGEPPPGWAGKTWACHQGAKLAQGEYLLFTDADTEHFPRGLRTAIGRMEAERIDLLSSPPLHRCPSAWERLLGPFQLLILTATNLAREPRPGRLFAIGQYLLFSKRHYEAMGGHASAREALAEDLALARLTIERGARYATHPIPELYSVRMYSSLPEFVRGWSRITRWGLKRSSVGASLETAFVVYALATAAIAPGPWTLAVALGLALLQARHGRFSPLGAVVFPFSLALFTLVTLQAAIDLALGREHRWRGRSYAAARE